jgi:hypothetical protein
MYGRGEVEGGIIRRGAIEGHKKSNPQELEPGLGRVKLGAWGNCVCERDRRGDQLLQLSSLQILYFQLLHSTGPAIMFKT